MFVADELLQPAGGHTRQHHAQSHEGRTDSVVGGFVFAVGEVDEVEHVGRETKSVAKLFDEDTEVDDEEALGLIVTEVNKRDTGERDAPSHRPKPFFKAAFGRYDSSNDSPYRQPQNTYRAIYQSHLSRGETQASQFPGIKQEGVDEFHQLGFAQALEQHEEDGHPYLFLLEEGDESGEELFEYVRGRGFTYRFVRFRFG